MKVLENVSANFSIVSRQSLWKIGKQFLFKHPTNLSLGSLLGCAMDISEEGEGVEDEEETSLDDWKRWNQQKELCTARTG
jgi:hypothetical protein